MENRNIFWEKEYSKGIMLNKYPFNYLVQIVMKYYGHVKDKSSLNVLEIGCGSGNNLYFLASEGFNVYGFDLSRSAIEFAQKRFAQDGLKCNLSISGFEYFDKDLVDKFDLIIERAVFYTQNIEYLQNYVFPKIKNSMKMNGIFISYYYNSNHPDKEFLKKIDVLSTPTKNEIIKLFSLFKIESISENIIKDVYGKSILGKKNEYIIIARKVDNA